MSKILDFLPPMIVGLAFIYMVAVVVTSVLESRRRAAATRARSEILNRILDKFGSSRDFVELSESPRGRPFFRCIRDPGGIRELLQ
jgi:hypothetical protein